VSQLLRTFIAIELPEPVRSELQRRLDSLARATPRGSVRWLPAASIHLTLKFLGEVDHARIPEIEDALNSALAGAREVEVALAGNGAFPNLTRPRVVWAGVRMLGGELASIVERLEQSMAGIGFAREARAFAPHLTLGRVREGVGAADLRAIGEAAAREPSASLLSFVVSRVTLFRSELRPEGAVYTRLAEFQLAGE
jgi:2'-5' RNA ligase